MCIKLQLKKNTGIINVSGKLHLIKAKTVSFFLGYISNYQGNLQSRGQSKLSSPIQGVIKFICDKKKKVVVEYDIEESFSVHKLTITVRR